MTCKKSHKKSKLYHYLIPGFLLAIIPKCPFCIMAYAGSLAILNVDKTYLSQEVMCNVDGASDNGAYWESAWFWQAFIFVMIGIVFYSLLKNYRGRKTYFALLLAVAGSGLVTLHILSLYTGLYYPGVLVLLIAAATNSFLPNAISDFLKKFQRMALPRLYDKRG